MHPATPEDVRAEDVRTYLQLTRLLDDVQRDHPEVSAPLRLTLLRARDEGQVGALDQRPFRNIPGDDTAASAPPR